jgi:hypothetical protein
MSADETWTISANPVPFCLRTLSCNSSKSFRFGAVSGSTQVPFTTEVAPIARSRRHSATRALDGVPGSCARSSSQPGGELSASTKMQHLFHIMDAAGYRNTYYNWQASGLILDSEGCLI